MDMQLTTRMAPVQALHLQLEQLLRTTTLRAKQRHLRRFLHDDFPKHPAFTNINTQYDAVRLVDRHARKFGLHPQAQTFAEEFDLQEHHRRIRPVKELDGYGWQGPHNLRDVIMQTMFSLHLAQSHGGLPQLGPRSKRRAQFFGREIIALGKIEPNYKTWLSQAAQTLVDMAPSTMNPSIDDMIFTASRLDMTQQNYALVRSFSKGKLRKLSSITKSYLPFVQLDGSGFVVEMNRTDDPQLPFAVSLYKGNVVTYGNYQVIQGELRPVAQARIMLGHNIAGIGYLGSQFEVNSQSSKDVEVVPDGFAILLTAIDALLPQSFDLSIARRQEYVQGPTLHDIGSNDSHIRRLELLFEPDTTRRSAMYLNLQRPLIPRQTVLSTPHSYLLVQ